MVLPALPASRGLQGSLVGNRGAISEKLLPALRPTKGSSWVTSAGFCSILYFLGWLERKVTGFPQSPRGLFCLLGKKLRGTNGSCVLGLLSFSVGFGYQIVSHLKMHPSLHGVTFKYSCKYLNIVQIFKIFLQWFAPENFSFCYKNHFDQRKKYYWCKYFPVSSWRNAVVLVKAQFKPTDLE